MRKPSKNKKPNVKTAIIIVAAVVIILFLSSCAMGWVVHHEWMKEDAAVKILGVIRIAVITGGAYYAANKFEKRKMPIALGCCAGAVLVLLLFGLLNGELRADINMLVLPMGAIAVGLLSGRVKRKNRG